MRNLVIFVFVLYLCQTATAYCCFRDPYMLPTTPCTNLCGSSSTNTATSCTNSGSSCTNTGTSGTNTGTSCTNTGTSCTNTGTSSNPANVCNVCVTSSPVCQCFDKCGCDGLKYPIYFPEVEYPMTIMEIAPCYYRTCFSL